MAIAYFHLTSQAGKKLDAGSTAVSDEGFSVPVDAANGVVVVLDSRYWSIKNTGKTTAGAASTKDIFVRRGSALPSVSFAANTTDLQTQWNIPALSDEIVGIRESNSQALALKSDTDTICVSFRPNTPHLKGP